MDNANGPQFFQLALPDDPQSLWDHSRFTPDAIVVCFGPNDFNQGLIDHESYTSSWTAFVRDIRTAHPDALIFLAESPMFGYDPDGLARRNRLRASLDATVLDCGRRGDTHVSVIPVGYFPGTRDNSHPVAFQHEQIALQMVEAIKKVTGW
jgi:hypothetical protein